MSTISIHLPPIEAEKAVDVEVSINGMKRKLIYRVEVFRWEDWCQPLEGRAECVKRMISAYDKNWRLLEIGSPTDREVPLTFKRVS
jgi:hypothetical protein